MFNTFNMGVGMAVIVSPETADAALSALKAEGIDAYVCGEMCIRDSHLFCPAPVLSSEPTVQEVQYAGEVPGHRIAALLRIERSAVIH